MVDQVDFDEILVTFDGPSTSNSRQIKKPKIDFRHTDCRCAGDLKSYVVTTLKLLIFLVFLTWAITARNLIDTPTEFIAYRVFIRQDFWEHFSDEINSYANNFYFRKFGRK